MKKLRLGQDFETVGVSVDNLMIDLNGLFHSSTQKIYEYGSYKPPQRLLGAPPRRKKMGGLKQQIKVFEDVCLNIEHIVRTVKPNKRVILCVDGPAPLAKQSQQRHRRFRAAMEKDEEEFKRFDSNSITPGTKFMDYLSKYIDWYIRKQISTEPFWKNLEVTYSSSSAPGEGEHKCVSKGTLILLWNGTIKKIEDIKVGDKLIGDDGKPRTVKSLVTGEDEMYEIVQNNGDNYTVNKNHILSLQIADHKRIYWSKSGCWVVGWYNRTTNKYERKQFSGLVDGDVVFTKMTEKDRTCEECKKIYTTRESYGKHMSNIHGIIVPKFKNIGKLSTKTKEEALCDAQKFLDTIPDDNILDISVKDYIKLDDNSKRKLYGFRCSGVKWGKQDVRIDPYLLGLWLGDGVTLGPVICNIDKEVIQFLEDYCSENGFRLSHNKKYIKYGIRDKNKDGNRMIDLMRQYNLIDNKHIPVQYKVNDEETRLKVLAGLIDSDGNVYKDGRLIRIAQCLEHKKLVDDIVYIGRSLGLCVNVRKEKCSYIYKDVKQSGECYQITISGDIHKIPVLVERKKCMQPPVPGKDGTRSVVVDKLRTSIKVKHVGYDTYYGINIDENNRFLLGDFTVTHNCINYIRYYGNRTDSYCIHGLDADLIMLALGTHLPNFWILREDLYDAKNEFYLIDIGKTRGGLAKIMDWNDQNVNKKDKTVEFNPEYAVNDFIFLCFMVGNDFLPHIPSLEIIEGGIDQMLDVYKNVGEIYGHLTHNVDGNVIFQKRSLEVFLGTIAQYDKGILEGKLMKKDKFFPDPLLEQNADFVDGRYNLDIEKYRKDYYEDSFDDIEIKDLCHQYLEGMQWVLSYYTRGVPDWKWCFQHHYAPFAHELAEHISDFEFPEKKESFPTTPFQQLLSVLPPKSSALIPIPLSQLLTDSRSGIKKYCPDTFEIDLSGKRKEWEGIVLLPMVNFSVIREEYFKHIDKVSRKDLERNILGKSFIYTYSENGENEFLSYYGNISNCKVKIEEIEI